MTKEQAQKIVENQGFAWTVTEVIEGDAFNLIYCDWDGKERLMYYSNGQKKVSGIVNLQKWSIDGNFIKKSRLCVGTRKRFRKKTLLEK